MVSLGLPLSDFQFVLSVSSNATDKDSNEEKYSDSASSSSSRNDNRCGIITISLSIWTFNHNSRKVCIWTFEWTLAACMDYVFYSTFYTAGIDFSETILTGTAASSRVTAAAIAVRITLETAAATIES